MDLYEEEGVDWQAERRVPGAGGCGPAHHSKGRDLPDELWLLFAWGPHPANVLAWPHARGAMRHSHKAHEKKGSLIVRVPLPAHFPFFLFKSDLLSLRQ